MLRASFDAKSKSPLSWPASPIGVADLCVRLKGSCFPHSLRVRHPHRQQSLACKPSSATAQSISASPEQPSAPASGSPQHTFGPWRMPPIKIVALLFLAGLAAGAPASVQASTAAAVSTKVQPSLTALFLAAVVPVIKVFLLCSIGAICAKKGLLAPEGRRVISSLVLTVFTPALFFSKLGSGVGLREAMLLWPLQAHMVAIHAVGLALGLALVKLVQPPKDLRNHLLVATAVGNVGNLPLVLISSLGSDPGLPFLLGTADAGLQFVILSNVTAAFIQFPLANALLKKSKPEPVPETVFASSSSQQQQQQQQQLGGARSRSPGGKAHKQPDNQAASLPSQPPQQQQQVPGYGGYAAAPPKAAAMAAGAPGGSGGGDVEMQAWAGEQLEGMDPVPRSLGSGPAVAAGDAGRAGDANPGRGRLFAGSTDNSPRMRSGSGSSGSVGESAASPSSSGPSSSGPSSSRPSSSPSSSGPPQSARLPPPVKGFEGRIPYGGSGPIWSRQAQPPADGGGPGGMSDGVVDGVSDGGQRAASGRESGSGGSSSSSSSNGSGGSNGGSSGRVMMGPGSGSSTTVRGAANMPNGSNARGVGYWSRSGAGAGAGADNSAWVDTDSMAGTSQPSGGPYTQRGPPPRRAPPGPTPIAGYWSRKEDGLSQAPQQQPPLPQPQPQPLSQQARVRQQQQQRASSVAVPVPSSPLLPPRAVPPTSPPSSAPARAPPAAAATAPPVPQAAALHPQPPQPPLPPQQPTSSSRAHPHSPPLPPPPASPSPPPASTPAPPPPSHSRPSAQAATLAPPHNSNSAWVPPSQSASPSKKAPIPTAQQIPPSSTSPAMPPPPSAAPPQPASYAAPPGTWPPPQVDLEAPSSDDEAPAAHAQQPLLAASSPVSLQQPNPGKEPGLLDALKARWSALHVLLSKSPLWRLCAAVATGVLTPPTIACFAGMLVASIKPLQAAVFVRGGPLYLLGDIGFMLGDCTVPALMLVLGGNLAKGPGMTTMPWRCLVGATVCRLLVLPVVGTALVLAARALGVGASLPPMAIMVMLVSASTPTAIMMHAIATVYDNRADDMAALLFWEYLLAALTLPLLIAAYLMLISS